MSSAGRLGGRSKRSSLAVKLLVWTRFLALARTLSGVFLVQEFGLTVGQDLDFRRVGALCYPRRHHSVEVLQTGHLDELQVCEGSDGVVGTVAGRAGGVSQIKGVSGGLMLRGHRRLMD